MSQASVNTQTRTRSSARIDNAISNQVMKILSMIACDWCQLHVCVLDNLGYFFLFPEFKHC